MSADAAFVLAELRKQAADLGVVINGCEQRGELSRAAHLSVAREAIFKAIHTPGRDERQLTLDATEHPGQGA